jgi:hypothetical protein
VVVFVFATKSVVDFLCCFFAFVCKSWSDENFPHKIDYDFNVRLLQHLVALPVHVLTNFLVVNDRGDASPNFLFFVLLCLQRCFSDVVVCCIKCDVFLELLFILLFVCIVCCLLFGCWPTRTLFCSCRVD